MRDLNKENKLVQLKDNYDNNKEISFLIDGSFGEDAYNDIINKKRE